MRPYLNLYYRSTYELLESVRSNYALKLKYALFQFKEFNPNFGRKVIYHKRLFGKIIEKKIEFNDKHIHFVSVQNKYQTSHIHNDGPIINIFENHTFNFEIESDTEEEEEESEFEYEESDDQIELQEDHEMNQEEEPEFESDYEYPDSDDEMNQVD